MKEESKKIVQLALIYHDVVYDPESTQNEFNSALYFESQMKHLGEALTARIKELIMSTKDHRSNGDELSMVVNDIDMSILQEDSEIYKKYSDSIEREFQVVDFKEKRIQFLESVLEQKQQIYQGDKYSNEKAYLNMK